MIFINQKETDNLKIEGDTHNYTYYISQNKYPYKKTQPPLLWLTWIML